MLGNKISYQPLRLCCQPFPGWRQHERRRMRSPASGAPINWSARRRTARPSTREGRMRPLPAAPSGGVSIWLFDHLRAL